MKKLLEAELVSIAHRILKLKGREDVDALLKEAQQVTQKLTVLKFYEDYKYIVENDIPQDNFDKQLINFAVESKIEEPSEIQEKSEIVGKNEMIDTIEVPVEIPEKLDFVEKNEMIDKIEKVEEEIFSENVANNETTTDHVLEPIELLSEISEEPKSIGELLGDIVQHIENQVEVQEDLVEDEDIQNELSNKELSVANDIDLVEDQENNNFDSSGLIQEEQVAEIVNNKEKKLEDLFQDFADFDFVKADENTFEKASIVENIQEEEIIKEELVEEIIQPTIDFSSSFERNVSETLEKKIVSLNDKLLGGVKIGLNDKIGFVKHLFDGSDEDFTRVISQLNTFTSHQEAVDFIENVVKPDYNNWENKDDYANRFLSILERSY